MTPETQPLPRVTAPVCGDEIKCLINIERALWKINDGLIVVKICACVWILKLGLDIAVMMFSHSSP